MKYRPEDGLVKPKHVAKLCITDYILMMCFTEQITLWTLYNITNDSYQNFFHASPAGPSDKYSINPCASVRRNDEV